MITNRYLGQFKNGLRHGMGTFYYADGSKYQGQWRDGMKQGLAEHMRDDGSCLEGIFEKDRLTVKLAIRLDEKDSLLCNHLTNQEDIPDVGNVTLGESTVGTNLRIANPLGDEQSKDMVDSKPDILNHSISHQFASLGALNPTLNRSAATIVPSSFKPDQPVLPGSKPDSDASKLTAAARRAAQRAKLPPVPKVVAHLQANPYLGLVNLDDILERHSIEERFTLTPIIIETFLRVHSQLKEIYTHYCKEHPGKSRNGTVFTRADWWNFIREYRLCTCRATAIQVDRLIANGKKNNYQLESPLTEVSATVERIKESAKAAGSFPDGFAFQPPSPSHEKVGVPRLASFDEEERSDDERMEKEKQATNQSDYQRGSISLDIDVVELMTDPSTFPEVVSFDAVLSV